MSTKNYRIIKGRELPKSGRSLGAFCPFTLMEIGDSFLFAEADVKRVQSLADAYGKKNGWGFFINMASENVCWRIS